MNRRGFTRFPNDFLEAIYTLDFTDRERRMLLFIIRFTYGCKNRKSIFLTNSDFSIIGIDRSDASKIVRKLMTKKVVEKKSNRAIGINLRIDEWMAPEYKTYSEEKDSLILRRALAKNPQKRGQFPNTHVGDLPIPRQEFSINNAVCETLKESKLKKVMKGTNFINPFSNN